MTEIANIKNSLHNPQILSVLADCQYMPTKEKLTKLADRYEEDAAVHAFGTFEGSIPTGVIILKLRNPSSYEILGIAVDSACRKQGIGSMLVSYAAQQLDCGELCAETDGDAVGFYRKYGFSVQSLGEKYPNCIRYLCKWRRPETA